MKKLTGQCLCGAVAYEITDKLPQYQEAPPEGLEKVRTGHTALCPKI